jgi:hypothetical protein
MSFQEQLQSIRDRYVHTAAQSRARLLKSSDRRRFARWSVEGMPATVFVNDKDYSMTVQDISLSGACVRGTGIPPLSKGETVILAAPLYEENWLIAACEVMVVQEAGADTSLGINFIALTEEETNVLLRYMCLLWDEAVEKESDSPLVQDAA